MDCRLKELRTARGLTQTGMAMELHVSQQTISRIELGISEIPTDLAIRAANYFHVSVDYVLGVSDERRTVSAVSKSLRIAQKYEDFLLEYVLLKPEYQRPVAKLIERLLEMQENL
ncbi:MAG: helix-turn-helix transcriptional regulator [Lachnospiraceae bacterium]|nr:helix-turn-helix transcriptional regulator [Lachnospiraceae bacterium]